MCKVFDTESFIARANAVHKNKYDYSKVEYKNVRTKVIIACPTHGDFEQNVRHHLRGCGCPKCGIEKCTKSMSLGLSKFIEKSKEIWGEDTFDYSKVRYKNNYTKVEITCNKHNKTFEQTPTRHYRSLCCPDCILEELGSNKGGYWTYER